MQHLHTRGVKSAALQVLHATQQPSASSALRLTDDCQ